jgi:hypothetical protein
MSESSITPNEIGKHETIVCKRCGSQFECKVGDVNNCQCSTVSLSDATRKFLANTHFGCLCAGCLTDIEGKVLLTKGKSFPKPQDQIENVHYYIENGFYVFTEHYHLLRGSCCQSGCRHCPYGYQK